MIDGAVMAVVGPSLPMRSRRGQLAAAAVAIALVGGSVIGFASGASGLPPWSIVSSPNVTGSAQDRLLAVSCTGPTNCFAVGSHALSSSSTGTLIERWNGTGWSIMRSPNATKHDVLNGVACTSAKNCFAVGYSGNKPLIERWHAAKWSIVPSPGAGARSGLNGVSCTSAVSCVAVGYEDVAIGSQPTLVERWNGTKWSIAPPARSAVDGVLNAVACTSATNCFAVGESGNTLIERWNGTTWSIVPSPNPGRTSGSFLYGVACTSAKNCFAVGTGSRPTPLIERWNGKKWSIVPSTAPDLVSELNAVSCTSATNCTAVGNTAVPSAQPNVYTLLEHWNGAKWSTVPSPNPTGSPINELLGVSCTSATNCTAVGYTATSLQLSGRNKTLVERS